MSDDAWMIERAQQWGTRPILTLTPLGEDGHFNNNLVSALVRSHELQQRIIWELGSTMQEKGFGGLDIDFEYVLADDREVSVRMGRVPHCCARSIIQDVYKRQALNI